LNLRPLVPQTSALTGLRYAPNLPNGSAAVASFRSSRKKASTAFSLCPRTWAGTLPKRPSIAQALPLFQNLVDQSSRPDQIIERGLQLAAIGWPHAARTVAVTDAWRSVSGRS
jgi:hypothetical protein